MFLWEDNIFFVKVKILLEGLGVSFLLQLSLAYVMYTEEEINNLKTVISMLSFGALERSNNSFIKTIVELCVSKNQKEMITMWVWLVRKSRKMAEAMKKVSLSWKRNLCMCVWEKNITSFEITVIILCYIRNVSLWFKKDFKSAELLTETFFPLYFRDRLNYTHRGKLVLYWNQYKISLKYKVGCLWRFSYIYTINSVLLIPLSYVCLKNVIHEIDSKNDWLLLSVTFTAKFELVFV